MATKRQEDINGYMKVASNPISKVGVFPYLGSTIGPECEPDKVYYVLRSAEELAKPDTLESFKNIPWVNEHTMLGSKDAGLTPAEEKGVHGVIGEDVYFDYPYVKANLVVFSESLRDIIDYGKKELSCGYRCDYEPKSGVFEGQEYQYVQTNIRGNHIATVTEGRMGPDVSVMDHSFTFDSKDLIMGDKATPQKDGQDNNPKGSGQDAEMTMSEISAALKQIMPVMAQMQEFMKMGGGGGGYDGEMPEKDGMEKDAGMHEDGMEKDGMEYDENDPEMKGKEKGEGMDSNDLAAVVGKAVQSAVAPLQQQIDTLKGSAMDSKAVITEMNKRDALVNKVTPFIGAFDHSDKTLAEVEKYSCEKLGLDAAEGMEGAVLAGYLHGRQPAQSFPVSTAGTGMDSASTSSPVDSFINGEDK